jgi:hypothetical protein
MKKNLLFMFLTVFLFLSSSYSYSFFSYQYENILNRNSIKIGGDFGLDPPINAYNLSVLFKWIPSYDFVHVSGKNGSYFAYLDNGFAVVLRDSSGYLNEDKIKDFLYLKYKKFPFDESALSEFMKDVTGFYIMPVFVMGSSKLYQDYERAGVLSAWLNAKEKRQSVFKLYCKDPVIAVEEKNNKWMISYYIFDGAGAVLRFNVTGSINPYSINKVIIQTVKESGAFSFPING